MTSAISSSAKQYGLPIVPVIRQADGVLNENPAAAFTDDGAVERSGRVFGSSERGSPADDE